MILALTRFVLVLGGLVGGWLATRLVDWQSQLGLAPSYVIFLFVILGAAIGYVAGGIIGRELTAMVTRVQTWAAELSGADLLLGTVGLVVGLLIAFLASQPLRLLQPQTLALGVSILLFAVAGYLGVVAALTRRREFVSHFPALAPVELRPAEELLTVLDTSTIIDGRFVDLRKLGVLHGKLRVPRFVLAELHTLSDSADDTRRARGRRGLDLLATLPDHDAIEVLEVDYPELAGVDDKLMRVAVDTGATVATVDFNLTKVARVRGIDVLNLNEIAEALRPNFLPGDTIHLKIARQGKEQGQGVGYLEDGTMVVVADGREHVGEESSVEVTSVLQTSAGRMIFAKLEASPD
ncbi:MAG TPA: TRAM domain-containing protein [Coriobacteriia bacterium]|nr:TRAM domain-containing protein [Coriobacteriia bacterium]